jgi:hypothetical protein
MTEHSISARTRSSPIGRSQDLTLVRPVLFLFSLLCAGCTVKYVEQYVVRDSVPSSPALTVIPATQSRADVSAADYLAGLLIGCGAKVLERPSMMKERKQFEGNAAGASAAFMGLAGVTGVVKAGSAGTSSGTQITDSDPVDALKQTSADYAFFVRNDGPSLWLRVTRRTDDRVLYSGFFMPADSSSSSPLAPSLGYRPALARIGDLLSRLGILEPSQR